LDTKYSNQMNGENNNYNRTSGDTQIDKSDRNHCKENNGHD
jgi:hypothetical protein